MRGLYMATQLERPFTTARYGFCGIEQCWRPAVLVAQERLKSFSDENIPTKEVGGG
jgi:hypothetical protein